MLTSKKTSIYPVVTYTAVIAIMISVITAFAPEKEEDQISLGLPIAEKSQFTLGDGYGERLHPVLQVMRLHTGIDLIANEGVPVVAAQDGVVIQAELAERWGNIVLVKHDNGYVTSYSHLMSMSVKDGDKITKGQQVGLVGHTGLSPKDHLHFELQKDGAAIDPIRFLPTLK